MWFLYEYSYYDYDVMVSLNIGLWWKKILFLEPRIYDHVIKGLISYDLCYKSMFWNTLRLSKKGICSIAPSELFTTQILEYESQYAALTSQMSQKRLFLVFITFILLNLRKFRTFKTKWSIYRLHIFSTYITILLSTIQK